jgi:hypothetical protein
MASRSLPLSMLSCVDAYAELMLGGDSSEFDGWHTSLSSDFEYQELSVPKDRRK